MFQAREILVCEQADLRKDVHRIIDIYEAVVSHGPISLDELYPLTKRSRTAVFRCLKELEKAGWIRTGLSKKGYFATSHVEGLLANGCVSVEEVDRLFKDLLRASKEYSVHVTFSMFVTPYKFQVIERTQNSADGANDEQFTLDSSDAMLTAFCALPPLRQRRLLDAALASCPGEEYRHHLTSRISECKRQMAAASFYLDAKVGAGSIAYSAPSGSVGAISVEVKGVLNSRTLQSLEDALCDIVDTLDNQDMLGSVMFARG